MAEELIRGMKSIADFFKLKKEDTIRQWERKYHLPIRRDPSGQAYAVTSELLHWLVIYDNERRKEKEKPIYRGAVKNMMERRMKRMEDLMK
jgi:hypothetical protein